MKSKVEPSCQIGESNMKNTEMFDINHVSKSNLTRKGFSLIEMLIVVGVFSILAVIVTQTLAASLRGSKKSENLGKVRENVEYALNYIERTLRSANKLDFDDNQGGVVDTCGTNNILYFYNNQGVSENFNYSNYRIRINTSDITSSEIRINSFVVRCYPGSLGEPDSVYVEISANDSSLVGRAESAAYTSSTTITLRNYSRN